MKVLGLSAAYNDEDTLQYFLDHLKVIYPSLSDHIFATNNCIDNTNNIIDFNDFRRISYNLHPDFIKRMDDPYSALAVAWQRLLREARAIFSKDGEYTHALYLDTDIFIQTSNALEVAASYGADILCGSYLRDFPDGRFLATTFQVNDDVAKMMPEYRSKRGEYYHFGQIFYRNIRPYCSSAGFMLLSRDIVLDKRVNFFPIYKVGLDGVIRKETSPEFGYQIQARTFGYETWLDGTIELKHYIGARHRAWRSDGEKYMEFKYPDLTLCKSPKKVEV